jgi:redox-sensitive bicupin YhaK (pirin superfamily)
VITLRPAAERGHAQHGWLDSWHSFSFADYRDPRHVHFGPLRVINEDRVKAGGGFPPHRHEDMEIISYVLDGELEHRDSLGTGSIIRPGDVQRMSAGRGVSHSEFNPSPTAPVHFLQIWIIPSVRGIAPEYEQRHVGEADRRGRLRLIASPEGSGESLRIHQDARVFAGLVGRDDDALRALGLHLMRDLRHREPAFHRLPAGHGHRSRNRGACPAAARPGEARYATAAGLRMLSR